MIKSAVMRTPLLVFILTFFALGYTIAHNKVVVLPLGSTEPAQDIYYASITAVGVIETGNIASNTQLSTGRHRVKLGRDATGCAATVNRGAQSEGGSIYFAGHIIVSVANDVYVTLYNSSVNAQNSDFHLVVICPKV